MKKVEFTTKYLISLRQLATKTTTYRFRIWSVIEEIQEALRQLAKIVKMQGEMLNTLIARTDENNPKVKDVTVALNRNSESIDKMGQILESKLPGIFPELNRDQTRQISKTVLKSLTKKKRVVFFSADGDLFLDAKKQYCYPLSRSRLKIMRVLVENNGYVPTDTLAGLMETTRKSLEYAIGRMNVLSKEKLKGIKVIKGRRSTGYRVHPDILIKEV